MLSLELPAILLRPVGLPSPLFCRRCSLYCPLLPASRRPRTVPATNTLRRLPAGRGAAGMLIRPRYDRIAVGPNL